MRYFLIAIVALMFGMGTVACDKKKPAAKDAPAKTDKKAKDKTAKDPKAKDPKAKEAPKTAPK